MPFRYSSMVERLLANTVYDPTRFGECWLYTGKKNSSGYGVVGVRFQQGPRRGKVKSALAHREAYKAFTGKRLPAGVPLLHKCPEVAGLYPTDQRACCNPAHLKRKNQKENVADTIKAGRHRYPTKRYSNGRWC